MKVMDFLVKYKNSKYASMVSDNVQVTSGILENMWNGLLEIHSVLHIRQDQAVILVPQERRIFKLNYTDSNVIMETMNKFARDSLFGENDNAHKMIQDLGLNREDLFVEKVPKQMSKSGVVDNVPQPQPQPIPNPDEAAQMPQFGEDRRGILKVLDIHDSKSRVYALNSLNAFLVDKETIYLPNVAYGDIVYLTYKPMPKPIRQDGDIDLPEELIDLLYLYCFKEQVKNYDMNIPPNVVQYYNTQYEERLNKKRLSGTGQIPVQMSAERLVNRKGFI